MDDKSVSALQIIDQAALKTGIKDVYLSHGPIYSSYWSTRGFGLPKEPADFDVSASSDEEAETIERALNEIAPDQRWSAFSRKDLGLRLKLGQSSDIISYLAIKPLIWRRCAVKLEGGHRLKFVFGPLAEASISQGILGVDSNQLEKLPPDIQQLSIKEGIGRARKALSEFPFLRVEGRLKEEFEAKYGPWKIDLVVVNHEEAFEGLSPEIREFCSKANRRPQASPAVQPAALPSALAKLKANGIKKGVAVPPPEGFRSWLEYCSSEASDAEWREWLWGQYRSACAGRQSWGGLDPTLAKIFSRSWMEQGSIPIYQWLPLEGHLVSTALQLNTDDVARGSADLIQALRLAALFHDADPGSAQKSSAIFRRLTLGLSLRSTVVRLCEWLIQSQDLLRTAVSPSASAQLKSMGFAPEYSAKLLTAIWLGDVKSSAQTRWMSPAAPLVTEFIRRTCA